MNIEQIVKDSKEIAINALKHFIKSLDLNEDAFNHIYEIPIKINNIGTDRISDYDPINNIIYISKSDLEEYIQIVKKQENKEKMIKLNIATAIIHEMIHANRTIQKNVIETKVDERGIKHTIISNQIKIDLASEFYHKNDNKTEEYKKLITKNQTSFEEHITEALSQIIILNRNKENIDLETSNKIIIENEENIGTVIASQILTNLGLENLKWFMTSAYDEVYDDKFERIFQEEYENLLTDANILEKPDKYNEFKVDYSIDDAYRIIEEKTGKKK